ncbi:MAG: NB-ARC domain-containing protein, partial [Cyanobacteria bacterium P01_F01_bin.86]
QVRGLKYSWQDKHTSSPQLNVETKLQSLITLSQKVDGEEALKGSQIREALNRLKDYLGILDDHRINPQGTTDWHFTLKLWASEKDQNLTRADQEWERKRRKQPSVLKQSKFSTKSLKRSPVSSSRYRSPLLPQHYVERPEHLSSVKQLLHSEHRPGALVISAIYGMGGIGKSVLAAALVQNEDVQHAFPDGALWITLGQNPDLLSAVNQWIRELGDYEYQPTTQSAASLHLQTLLINKQMLLVVDDVWHPEHVDPFRVGGERCCLLITTRHTKINGAMRYDLRVMTPQQSIELLSRYLRISLTSEEEEQATVFAEEVGHLPLALELAATQIMAGTTWDDLLEDFQNEVARLETLNLDDDEVSLSKEDSRKRRSLLASFSLTLKLLSPERLTQLAWLGVVPEDVTITRAMAATLWQVAPKPAGDILRDLKDKALLISQVSRPGQKPTYRIHDLVHDLARNLLTKNRYLDEFRGLGLTVQAAHSKLLGHYRSQLKDKLWHTVPNDGYIHAHLAWHFEQAGQPELLHQLLKESTPEGRNGWYEACDQLGQTANFVTDIAKAWKWAECLYQTAPSLSLALQVRYALITTTLNSLAQNTPAELISIFVEKKFWPPAQGLAYVKQIQNPTDCANAV